MLIILNVIMARIARALLQKESVIIKKNLQYSHFYYDVLMKHAVVNNVKKVKTWAEEQRK